MSIVRATLDGLAKFLGAEPHQAEVVYSEKSARAAFSRRGLFKAAGAVAAGTLFADVLPVDPSEAYELRLVTYPQFVVSYSEMLKESYSDDRIRRLLFPDNPLLRLLEKQVRV